MIREIWKLPGGQRLILVIGLGVTASIIGFLIAYVITSWVTVARSI